MLDPKTLKKTSFLHAVGLYNLHYFKKMCHFLRKLLLVLRLFS